MKAISFWAQLHVAKARFAIIIIKILLLFLAIKAGNLLSENNTVFNTDLLFFVTLIILVCAIVYPQKKFKNKIRNFYFKQKCCDFALAASTFISIMIVANNNSTKSALFPMQSIASNTIAKPTAQQILESLKYRNKKSLTKEEKRILRKEFYHQAKIYTISSITKDEVTKKNSGLIILTIIGAVGLLFLLSGLVCSLSCNGSDAAAVIVAVLGLTAIIWGSIALIRKLKGKHRNKHMEEESLGTN